MLYYYVLPLWNKEFIIIIILLLLLDKMNGWYSVIGWPMIFLCPKYLISFLNITLIELGPKQAKT